MPTTVTHTIGSTGDYTTIALWFAACPANLVSSDQIWRGELLNEEFSSSSTLVTISGITTDSTRYVELTVQAGASFADNANKLTNALRYNASNGAAIKRTGSFGYGINVSTSYTRLSRFMFQTSDPDGLYVTATNCQLSQIIAEGLGNNSALTLGNGGVARNVIVIADTNTGIPGFQNSGGGTISLYNCAAVRPSNRTVGGTAFSAGFGAHVVKNCAAFGFSTAFSANYSSGSNNATNLASIGGTGLTASQTSLTYADQFEQPSNASGTMDFRTKSGATLTGNGADTSGNGVTTDIVGTSLSAPYPIGVWQYASASNNAIISGTVSLTGSATAALALDATIAGTLPLTGSATAALALDAQISGTVPLTGSATAVTTRQAQITGAVPLTGSATATTTRQAQIVGLLPLTGSMTATNGGQAIDTHDGFLRRSRRQRAADAARRRIEEEQLADRRALRLSLEAAMGMAAEVVEDAPEAAAEAVQEAVQEAQAVAPVLARAVDVAALDRARRAVEALQAAVEEAMRAKALADDDEEVEMLLRAL